ncbi:hypothetical protein CRG98_010047 [Punica granatum]|uniref:Uncharacterized protein n=1 Tax=Punica granatum TaxID=22663 RepID=A0A2I0KM56_PUNGR|nr:hypothetical protein CRG98_010047 [Punica granatum]
MAVSNYFSDDGPHNPDREGPQLTTPTASIPNALSSDSSRTLEGTARSLSSADRIPLSSLILEKKKNEELSAQKGPGKPGARQSGRPELPDPECPQLTTHTAPDPEGPQLTTPTAPRSRVLSARVPDSSPQLDPQLQISPPVCLPAEPSTPFQFAPLPQFSNRKTRDSGDRLPRAQGPARSHARSRHAVRATQTASPRLGSIFVLTGSIYFSGHTGDTREHQQPSSCQPSPTGV